MSLLIYKGDNLLLLKQHKIRARKQISGGCKRRTIRGSQLHLKSKRQEEEEAQGLIERIKQRFNNLELSVSSYDTAWVAMVPSNRGSPNQQPCFPGSLEWIMENQKTDGSWGLHPTTTNPSLVKDSLSSTLACVLALKKWSVGEQLVQKGLDFIESNRSAVRDNNQISPMGFDIIFPGMTSYAQDLGLNVPLDSVFSDGVLQIQSWNGKGRHIGYFAEGLGEKYEWEEMIKREQRRNGSVFNSPATTAAAFIHLQDDKCFHYLNSLVELHGNAVPTIYPYGIYVRLCIVDTLERVGIARYFAQEINMILDETYRCWQLMDEEIFKDAACCALAFRLLRMHGYEVASKLLGDHELLSNTRSSQFADISTILELYKASEIKIHQEEPVLENIHNWTNTFLKHQLLNEQIRDNNLQKEVEYTLEFSVDRQHMLAQRRGIEIYDPNRIRMLKTSYRCSNIDNVEILKYSIHDYSDCQAIFRQEIDQLKTWVKKSTRMVSLSREYWKDILIGSYHFYTVFEYPQEESDARIVWGKASCIATLIDDLFDIDGSTEELLNIIQLLDKWDDHSNVGYCSERIEILFLAIREFVHSLTTKGFVEQGRCIKQELINLWVDMIKCMLREHEWWKNKSTPSMEEYLTNGVQTIGLPIYVLGFYFLGVEFTPDIYTSQEYKSLYYHGGLINRLFNDYYGLEAKVDKVQRKMNSVWLLMEHSNGGLTEEDAKAEVMRMIEFHKRELLRLFAQKEGSVVPKPIRECFLNLNKIAHYLYDHNNNDNFRYPTKGTDEIKDLIYDPINIPKDDHS